MRCPTNPTRRARLGEIIAKLNKGKALTGADQEFLAAPLNRALEADQLDEIFELEPRRRVTAKIIDVLIHYRIAVGDRDTPEGRRTAATRVAKKFSMEPESVTRIVNRYLSEGLIPRRHRPPTADPANVLGRRSAKKKE